MKKVVLLTGAAGFIGSNLLIYLFDKYPNYHFLVLDSITYAGNQKNIPEYIQESDRFEFWYGDVTNPYIVNELMKRADMVVHMAAETHVARSIFDNSKFFHTDVIGTQVLMNALLQSQRIERFIHISSSEVYGTALTEPMMEEHTLAPRSPYAGAKAGADRLVHSYWCSYPQLPVMILRPFNNYGARQHLEKMTPRFITSALKDEPLRIHGDGTAGRDWVYVKDCCDAIDKALHISYFERIRHSVINIGTGKSTSVLDMARLVLKIIGKSEDFIQFIGDRPGQVKLHISSTEKANKFLNWQAETPLEKGIKETIDWYKNNEVWWKEQKWMKEVPIYTTSGKIEMH